MVTLNRVEISRALPTEIYEMRIELFDDNGTPFIQPPNYNTELVLSVYY
jgi:hypothetical protein